MENSQLKIFRIYLPEEILEELNFKVPMYVNFDDNFKNFEIKKH